MAAARNLTAVLIVYRQKRLNHRLRFGAPVVAVRLGWRRRLVAFSPGAVFGYVRWSANQYGTQDWRLLVLRATTSGPVTSVPGVMPGADILLATRGATRSRRALAALDRLEAQCGRLENISPAYWRHLHNRLAVSMVPHGFSPLQASSFDRNCR